MNPVTLYSFVNALPELQGRVFIGAAPERPDTPYAVVWEKPGGISAAFYGGSDVVYVYPCVTVYDKPLPGEVAADAHARMRGIILKLQGAIRAVNTHADTVTPYLTGSVNRVMDPVSADDPATPGQVKAVMQITAQLYRP